VELHAIMHAETVSGRHVDVEQHQVRLRVHGEIERLVAVLDGDDFETMLREHLAHLATKRRLVFGNENLVWLHGEPPSVDELEQGRSEQPWQCHRPSFGSG
jgi:hypothetical protein